MNSTGLPCKTVNEFKMVTSETVKMVLLNSKFKGRFLILDCRFSYEFEGGHIVGAENIPSPSMVQKFFENVDNTRPLIIIFHCEFSSKRAPETLRALRKIDRNLNLDNWPNLYYPELYLLEGGYSAFWSSFPDLCTPQGYVKMNADQQACVSGHLLRKNWQSSFDYVSSPSPMETCSSPTRDGTRKLVIRTSVSPHSRTTSPRRFQDRLSEAGEGDEDENENLNDFFRKDGETN